MRRKRYAVRTLHTSGAALMRGLLEAGYAIKPLTRPTGYWTSHRDTRHIISMRKANEREITKYEGRLG